MYRNNDVEAVTVVANENVNVRLIVKPRPAQGDVMGDNVSLDLLRTHEPIPQSLQDCVAQRQLDKDVVGIAVEFFPVRDRLESD